jgi:proline dehydrogenase
VDDGVVSIDRVILFRLATSGWVERGVRAVAAAERAAWRAARRYVAGTELTDALRLAGELHARGVASSIDQFGEQVVQVGVADRVAADYLGLAGRLAGSPDSTWLSVDLSHLGLDVDPAGCVDRLAAIAAALPGGRRIQVGAEDHDRVDAVLNCVLAVAGSGLAGRLGATVQANYHRSPADLPRLVEAGVHIRLVKGAYVEPAHRALSFGEPTNIAYLRLAHQLAADGGDFALATHDGVIREALLTALGPRPVEQLLGVRPDTVDDLVARGVPVRLYVPYGPDWFRYWMRRLAESRGA